MSEELLDRLRADAGELRYEPRDPFVYARLASQVAARIAEPRGVLDFIGAWFRPVVAMLALMVVISGVSFYSLMRLSPLELLASAGALPAAESHELR